MSHCVDSEEDGGLRLVVTPSVDSPAGPSCGQPSRGRKLSTIYPLSSVNNLGAQSSRRHSDGPQHTFVAVSAGVGLKNHLQRAVTLDENPIFIADFYDADDDDVGGGSRTVRSPTIVSRPKIEQSSMKIPPYTTNADGSADLTAVGRERSSSAGGSSVVNGGDGIFQSCDLLPVTSTMLAVTQVASLASSITLSSSPVTATANADAPLLPVGVSSTSAAPPWSTPLPTDSTDSPVIRQFDRQFSAVEPSAPRYLVASSLSTPHLERAWRQTQNSSFDSLGATVQSQYAVGLNGMANGPYSFHSTAISGSTSSLCGARPAPSTSGVPCRTPMSAGISTPSTSSTTSQKMHGAGTSDQLGFMGSSGATSTPTGLRPNKSRTSFATLNPLDDESDKPFYMKQMASEYGMAKHLHTEQVMSKHNLKGKMTKFQRLFDRAFTLINLDTEDAVVEGAAIVAKVMINAWVVPKIGHDLAYGLCDYLREMGYVDLLLQFYMSSESKHRVRMAAGRALEECFSGPNRDYVVSKEFIEPLVSVALNFKDGEEQRVGVSLLESLFKQSSQTNARLIELGALDYVLAACNKTSTASGGTQLFRHAALALANLSMYSENECQQKMIAKNLPDWLFLLASSQDDVTRYYACMAICALVSNKEIEAAVIKSGTLSLVEPFLLAHKPADFAHSDYRHNQGRPREWLEKLTPMLSAKRREPRSMAAFHFAMEAGIKKEQDQLEVFEEIGATEALKQVASYPEEVGPKFATMALEIIGAEVPYKLGQQVPLWSVEDVQYWVTQISFDSYAQTFSDQKVDGDILLLLTNSELEHDIGMKSGLLRRRFMRELDSLKMSADYSCVDETQLDRFLVSISPQFSVYTYQLLEKGADRPILPSMTDEVLKNDLGIRNPIDRMRLIQALEECKHIDDMEIAILSRHIDIFISYRRSTGNQLASLIKVLLQLRGYKVFIDVDRLYAGKFDLSLLKNIQAAKHFVLVLTPQALQRCVGDDECHDWVHKEVLCAMEHNKNVIPILDPQFEWPEEHSLPQDIRVITRFNGVRWVHEYQEACVDKVEKFIKGEFNMNRGFYPHQDRNKRLVNFRSGSSKQNSNGGSHSGQMTPSQSVADSLLDTLSNVRSRAPSREELSAVGPQMEILQHANQNFAVHTNQQATSA